MIRFCISVLFTTPSLVFGRSSAFRTNDSCCDTPNKAIATIQLPAGGARNGLSPGSSRFSPPRWDLVKRFFGLLASLSCCKKSSPKKKSTSPWETQLGKNLQPQILVSRSPRVGRWCSCRAGFGATPKPKAAGRRRQRRWPSGFFKEVLQANAIKHKQKDHQKQTKWKAMITCKATLKQAKNTPNLLQNSLENQTH